MSQHARGRLAAAAVLGSVAVLTAACGGSSSGGSEADGDSGSCPSTISEKATTQPPSDIPTPDGADTAYEYFAQGATKVWNFALDGSEVVALRDAYDKVLQGKGYEIEGTDAEDNEEAESEFKGPHEGTTNFRHLCSGKIVLRLKLTT